jgi:hypothetical protein
VLNLPEEKAPKTVNEEVMNIEASEEAAQDYIRIIKEEECEEEFFDWF